MLSGVMADEMDTSLNFFIRNGFEPHPFYYNCSLIEHPNSIGTKRPFWGAYFMITGCFLMLIYLPCLYVIARSDLMKTSCYKIMLFLGFLDIGCISTNSLATGFLGFVGATFCSYPRFIFIMGSIGCGFWMGSCSTCILLAINRCCDINHNLIFGKMFSGRNIWFTMIVPLIYTVIATVFLKPVLFNSNYMSWFFNPFLGLDPSYYVNLIHTINNCSVAICTTVIYGYLCTYLFLKNRHSHSDALSKTQKQIFIQSVIICSFNAIAAYIYVYMQFFYSPPEIILIGQLAWQFRHGSVCIVYITMNKTIRRKVFKLMLPRWILQGSQIGATTTVSSISIATKSGISVIKQDFQQSSSANSGNGSNS